MSGGRDEPKSFWPLLCTKFRKKNGMAPESIDKDVCELLTALEVACATRAGLISAGAHISYR